MWSDRLRSLEESLNKGLRLFLFQTYDATALVGSYSGPQLDILIEQGRDDQFLSAGQLLPDNLIAACTEKKIPVVFRLQQVSAATCWQKGKKLFHLFCIQKVFSPSLLANFVLHPCAKIVKSFDSFFLINLHTMLGYDKAKTRFFPELSIK